MLVDTLHLDVQGGRGGDGCVSFRRERYAPRGGPNGGDGGDGGDVVAVVDPHVQDLSHLVPRRLFRAQRGQNGQGRKIHGRNGDDLLLRVPAGTLVLDARGDKPLAELTGPGQEETLTRGGRGGKGNARFVTPTNRAPRRATCGERGEKRSVVLEFRLSCDVALIGLPNSGKSLLLTRLTGASPKVAPYPFTTTQPEAGVITAPGFVRLVIVELPPLVRGACQGKGLGCAFLRHAERASLLALALGPGPPGPRQSYLTILEELAASGRDLGEKPHIVVLTKTDVWSPPDADAFPHAQDVIAVSALKGKGIQTLLGRLGQILHR